MARLLSVSLLLPFLLVAATLAVEVDVSDDSIATPKENAALPALPLTTERAFPNLRMRRPVIIEHAGDGSGRLFVAAQQGVIHIMPDDENSDETQVFLDMEKRVTYHDKMNEEGLLGLAFHPKYKQNGRFFVYYTIRGVEHTSVISEFKVSKDDPNQADLESEREIMRIKQPFWNHNGGTILFGPDGYLYVGLGDGGSANDPMGHGQNLTTLLGSILRIDVDGKAPGKQYAIPKDNPFVGREDARGEIWAYGLRNVWRMSFDRKTGKLWAGDVGQNLWEEVNIIVRGGNYGWNLREAMHPFGEDGVGPREDLIDPIWEYHHKVGKSITGGPVYRGKQLPILEGKYLFGDYVTGLFWALEHDPATRETKCWRIEPSKKGIPVMTFGETAEGEVLFGDAFGRLFRFVKK